MIYIFAFRYKIDVKTIKLISFVFCVLIFLSLSMHLILYLGLEMVFGYLVILFDVIAKKVLFTL